MGSLYRSEEMTRCQLFLQTEAAYSCVAELGELGLVQFRDLNTEVSAFQRKFVNEVRRCEEMDRKLRFLEREIRKDQIQISDTGEVPDAPQPREMIDLEATFEKLENEMREVNANQEMLEKNFLELSELKHILRKTQEFFDEHEDIHAMHTIGLESSSGHHGVGVHGYVNPALDASGEHHAGAPRDPGNAELKFVAGVIRLEKLLSFERLLWRACRGNVFLRHSQITDPLDDPVTGLPVRKAVFVIFFQGEQLMLRVKKICEGFRASLYPCPDTPQERREMAIGVMTRIEDLKTVLGQTQDHRRRVLVAAAKNVGLWLAKVRKIKAIYHTLNLFNIDVTQKALIAECWCPVADLDKIHLALKRGTEDSGSTVPSILHRMQTDEMPPTFFRTNKFTKGFQNIVDAYGMANYQEINPAPYTIITFPFLFAVMFGDFGHGLLMFLFALYMVVRERQIIGMRIKDEIFSTFFGGRYIILLMGSFSIYTGLVYNDVFSKSFNIFGSSWRPNYDLKTLESTEKLMLDPNSSAFSDSPYPYGVDPVWVLADDNKLLFLNSFKMKMSIILGVFHMLFGVFLSCLNHRFFRKPINIICEFIPQLVFLSSLFLYLVMLIFVKWTHFGPKAHGDYPGIHCAPQLLIGTINMFMFTYKGKMTADAGDKHPQDCFLYTFYTGQQQLQTFLVILAVMCVPWMLLVKPIVMWRRKRSAQRYVPHVDEGRAEPGHEDSGDSADSRDELTGQPKPAKPAASHGGHGEDEDTSDMFILQAIHTIEFCLGCISHTASYLRLWALSLAHAELSDVLWTMVMRNGFSLLKNPVTANPAGPNVGAVPIYVIFCGFAALTIAILILMEGLSAFLHALRLHWVEFNSKFYHGEGYGFAPFSFDTILAGSEDLPSSG